MLTLSGTRGVRPSEGIADSRLSSHAQSGASLIELNGGKESPAHFKLLVFSSFVFFFSFLFRTRIVKFAYVKCASDATELY